MSILNHPFAASFVVGSIFCAGSSVQASPEISYAALGYLLQSPQRCEPRETMSAFRHADLVPPVTLSMRGTESTPLIEGVRNPSIGAFGNTRTDFTKPPPYIRFHAGVDLVGVLGDSVLAVSDGVVVAAREGHLQFGKFVILRSTAVTPKSKKLCIADFIYAHLSEILVKESSKVARGAEIGKMGRSKGDSTLHQSIPTHLHFEFWVGKKSGPVHSQRIRCKRTLDPVQLFPIWNSWFAANDRAESLRLSQFSAQEHTDCELLR